MRLIPLSLFLAATLTACTGSDQPYYTSRDAYAAAVDAGNDFIRQCGRQVDETACAPVSVRIVSLEAAARTEIFNAEARESAGNKTGAAMAEAAAERSIDALSDYVASHSLL